MVTGAVPIADTAGTRTGAEAVIIDRIMAVITRGAAVTIGITTAPDIGERTRIVQEAATPAGRDTEVPVEEGAITMAVDF